MMSFCFQILLLSFCFAAPFKVDLKINKRENRDGIDATLPVKFHQPYFATANFQVGLDHPKNISLMLDTGSAWLWAYSEYALNAPAFTAKVHQSALSPKNKKVNLSYGMGGVSGYNYNETICVPGSFCIHDFEMMLGIHQMGMGAARSSGLIGLCPMAQQGSQHFITQLKKDDVIKQAIFSLSISTYADSHLMIGGYDSNKYALTDLVWHDVDGGNQTMFWKVIINEFAMHFGGTNETIEFKDDDNGVIIQDGLKDRAVFDSGTSYTMIPPTSGNILKAELKKRGLECKYNYQMMNFNCPCQSESDFDNFPDLRITVNGTHIFIPREDYLKYSFADQSCMLLIADTNAIGQSEWVLGIDFMENYYMVFDNDNYRVGLAPSKTSSQRMINTFGSSSTNLESLQQKKLNSHGPSWSKGIHYMILIIVAVIGIYYCLNNYLKTRARRIVQAYQNDNQQPLITPN